MIIMPDKNLQSVIRKRMEKTMASLKKNNMECFIADSSEKAVSMIRDMLEPGSTVAAGGSQTLAEAGIIDLLRSGDYQFLDRSGLAGDAIKKCYRDSLSADTYICSSNAITENGELYNVDGNGNRAAAICYGPDTVIIVAGYNKIVRDLDEAVRRVKTVSAPANTARLCCDTYCSEKGECMTYVSADEGMTSGCRAAGRICCNYVITGFQRVQGRIKVILVCEELGY